MEKLIWNYSFWLKRWNVYLLKFCPKKLKKARAYIAENLIFHILLKHSFVFQIIAFHNSQVVKTNPTITLWNFWQPSLRKKHPNTEFFLVRIFPYLNWIRRNTRCLSVFTPNAGKYGPEKTPYHFSLSANSIIYHFMIYNVGKK